VSIADRWYASAALLPATGVVVTLLAAVITAWVTYVVGVPKRRLLYGMPLITPLRTAPVGVGDDLELRHTGKLLAEPHIVKIQLVSRGRKDTPTSLYDSGDPIRLDVGARIVEILQETSDPQSVPAPKVTVDGTSLTIGPSRISRRQKIAFTLLTDGGRPYLTCQSPLIDVQVRHQKPDELMPRRVIALAAVLVVSAASALWVLSAASAARSEASTARTAASLFASQAASEARAAASERKAAASERKAAGSERKAAASARKAAASHPGSHQTLLIPAAVAVRGIRILMASQDQDQASKEQAQASKEQAQASKERVAEASALMRAKVQTLTGWALAALATLAAVALVTVVVALRRWRR
jgi:hypothetical protein